MTNTSPNKLVELEPCPWCGGVGEAAAWRLGEYPWIVRYEHSANCPIRNLNPFDFPAFHSKAEAIEAWNQRAARAFLAGLEGGLVFAGSF